MLEVLECESVQKFAHALRIPRLTSLWNRLNWRSMLSAGVQLASC